MDGCFPMWNDQRSTFNRIVCSVCYYFHINIHFFFAYIVRLLRILKGHFGQLFNNNKSKSTANLPFVNKFGMLHLWKWGRRLFNGHFFVHFHVQIDILTAPSGFMRHKINDLMICSSSFVTENKTLWMLYSVNAKTCPFNLDVVFCCLLLLLLLLKTMGTQNKLC